MQLFGFSLAERLIIILIAFVIGLPVLLYFNMSIWPYLAGIVAYHVLMITIGGFIKAREL